MKCWTEQDDYGNWYVVVEEDCFIGSSYSTQGFQKDRETAEQYCAYINATKG